MLAIYFLSVASILLACGMGMECCQHDVLNVS